MYIQSDFCHLFLFQISLLNKNSVYIICLLYTSNMYSVYIYILYYIHIQYILRMVQLIIPTSTFASLRPHCPSLPRLARKARDQGVSSWSLTCINSTRTWELRTGATGDAIGRVGCADGGWDWGFEDVVEAVWLGCVCFSNIGSSLPIMSAYAWSLNAANGSATYHEVSCLCLHQPLTIHINSRSQQNHGHTSQSPPYQAVFPVTKKVKSQCSHFNLPSLTVFQHQHHPTHGPTIPPRPHLSAAGEPPFLRNRRINRNWHWKILKKASKHRPIDIFCLRTSCILGGDWVKPPASASILIELFWAETIGWRWQQ